MKLVKYITVNMRGDGGHELHLCRLNTLYGVPLYVTVHAGTNENVSIRNLSHADNHPNFNIEMLSPLFSPYSYLLQRSLCPRC